MVCSAEWNGCKDDNLENVVHDWDGCVCKACGEENHRWIKRDDSKEYCANCNKIKE